MVANTCKICNKNSHLASDAKKYSTCLLEPTGCKSVKSSKRVSRLAESRKPVTKMSTVMIKTFTKNYGNLVCCQTV